MFSSDIAKIRVAELKAKGDGGTIQRLRKSCADVAAVLDHTAKLVTGRPMSRKQRAQLADELRRGASTLRGLVKLSAPSGSIDAARVADLAHKALNTGGEKAAGEWAVTLLGLRTEAREALGLPRIPKGRKGSK